MKRLTLFIILLISFDSYAQENRIILKHISNVNGLSSNRIFNVFEDSKGLIWLSTGDGLDLYDGSTIKQFYKNTTVFHVIEDTNNACLYISTIDGLIMYNRETNRFSNPSFSKGKVSAIALNNKDELLMASISNFRIVQPNRKDYEEFTLEDNKRKNSINTLCHYINGQIIVGAQRGIFKLDRENKKFIPLLENLKIENIVKLYIDSQNNLWICTNNDGLYCCEGSDFSKKPKYYSVENGFMLTNKTRDIIEIEPNKYYVLNRNGGLVHLNTKTNKATNYTPDDNDPQSLSSKALTTLYKDYKDNIWVGTFRNGVGYIDKHRKKFEHYKRNFKENGLLNNNVSSFVQDVQGDIWVGTDNGGGLSKFDRETGTFTNYKTDYNNPNGLQDEYVLCLEELDPDHLLLGTLKKGIEVFNKKTKRFSHYPITKKGRGENDAFFIKKDLKGNIWVAAGVGFYKFDIASGTFLKIENIERVESIEQGDENTIWMATYNTGLYELNVDTHKYKKFVADSATSSKELHSLLSIVKKDSKGNLWIGSNGAGLYYIETASNITRHFDSHDGLIHNQVTNILFENDSLLWVSTTNGLSRFDVNNKKFRNYDVHDGLQGNEFGIIASMKAKNGELYFAGRNGFNIFDPKNIVDNPHVPNVLLTDFKLFNKSVAVDTLDSPLKKHIAETKKLTLNHEQSVITFAFVAINYTSPEKNQYAYRLDGFDNEWNYIDNKREATYTNLPPGKYTLRVKASNNDGIWNKKGVSLELIILPPWWATWWFRTIALCTIVGGSILFYIIRMHQMKVQHNLLEATVAERTRDLQETNIILEESKEEISQQNEAISHQNTEITKAYHIVEQKNENIKASISYAKTIQNAILPTQADMNCSFNSFVIFKPKDIVSGDFYWMSRIDDSTSIVAAVDCTGHGVPGAFMSMIGSRLLNNIVNEQKIHSPKDILSKMNIGIKKALKQETSENDDGMDICLCKIVQNDEIKITYSGAKRPLYYFDSQYNSIQRIKGSLNAIGGVFYLDDHPYTNTEITLQKDDQIFLTSDGYIDQNNVGRKSYGTIKFKNLLKTIATLSIEEQKTKMNEELNAFMDGTKQRDDIVVIGIKF